jgi:hypothetical protein
VAVASAAWRVRITEILRQGIYLNHEVFCKREREIDL